MFICHHFIPIIFIFTFFISITSFLHVSVTVSFLYIYYIHNISITFFLYIFVLMSLLYMWLSFFLHSYVAFISSIYFLHSHVTILSLFYIPMSSFLSYIFSIPMSPFYFPPFFKHSFHCHFLNFYVTFIYFYIPVTFISIICFSHYVTNTFPSPFLHSSDITVYSLIISSNISII